MVRKIIEINEEKCMDVGHVHQLVMREQLR